MENVGLLARTGGTWQHGRGGDARLGFARAILYVCQWAMVLLGCVAPGK